MGLWTERKSGIDGLAPDEILVKIFDQSYEWTEDDNRYLMEECFYKEIGYPEEAGLWTYPVEVIIKLDTIDYGERFFRIGYDCGLTEYQDTIVWDTRPVEVRLHRYTKTIEVEEWEEV